MPDRLRHGGLLPSPLGGIPPDDVGGAVDAEVLQSGSREAGGVALLTEHDDEEVVVGQRQGGLARRVETPLEHVPLDDGRQRQVSLGRALGGRPDVDDDGAAAVGGVGLRGSQALQVRPLRRKLDELA